MGSSMVIFFSCDIYAIRNAKLMVGMYDDGISGSGSGSTAAIMLLHDDFDCGVSNCCLLGGFIRSCFFINIFY